MRAPQTLIPPPFFLGWMSDSDVADVSALGEPSPIPENDLRIELSRSFSKSWVMREGGTAVAFLMAWHILDELHVLNVATRTDRRRRGIARSLIGAAIDYARERGVLHLMLEVRRSNFGAIRLYRSVGFFAMGIRARYYSDDEDAVEMVLQLDPTTRDVVPHADEVKLES